MLNKSSPTLPKSRRFSSSFGSSIKIKFLTDGLSTRPLKLSTQALICSFHLGGLFLNYRISKLPSVLQNFKSQSGLVCRKGLVLQGSGAQTSILRGPFVPKKLVQYSIVARFFLISQNFLVFSKFKPASYKLKIDPIKLLRSLPRQSIPNESGFNLSNDIAQLEEVLPARFLPAIMNLKP